MPAFQSPKALLRFKQENKQRLDRELGFLPSQVNAIKEMNSLSGDLIGAAFKTGAIIFRARWKSKRQQGASQPHETQDDVLTAGFKLSFPP